jgi:hypothetical protein
MAAIGQSTRTHRSAALERANHDDCSRRPGPQPPAHRKLADAGDALKLDDTEDAVVGFRTEAPNSRDESALSPLAKLFDPGAERRTRIASPTASDEGPHTTLSGQRMRVNDRQGRSGRYCATCPPARMPMLYSN